MYYYFSVHTAITVSCSFIFLSTIPYEYYICAIDKCFFNESNQLGEEKACKYE